MPFFLRKSFKLGPLRFNLSKSGIGLSAGVKGARMGIRPDGRAYHHAGRFGLYHRGEHGKSSYDGTWFGRKDKQAIIGPEYEEFKVKGVKAHMRLYVLDSEQLGIVNKAIPDMLKELYETGGEDMIHDQFYFKLQLIRMCSYESDKFWNAFDVKDEEYQRNITEDLFADLYELNPSINLSHSVITDDD